MNKTLIIGGASSGKTIGFVIPEILRSELPVVYFGRDLNREISAHYTYFPEFKDRLTEPVAKVHDLPDPADLRAERIYWVDTYTPLMKGERLDISDYLLSVEKYGESVLIVIDELMLVNCSAQRLLSLDNCIVTIGHPNEITDYYPISEVFNQLYVMKLHLPHALAHVGRLIPEFSKLHNEIDINNVYYFDLKSNEGAFITLPDYVLKIIPMSLSLANQIFSWTSDEDNLGISANTMLVGVTGKSVYSNKRDIPTNEGDLSRCFKLCQMIPVIENNLDLLAYNYPKWEPIVREWSTLKELYFGNKPYIDFLDSLLNECRNIDNSTLTNTHERNQ